MEDDTHWGPLWVELFLDTASYLLRDITEVSNTWAVHCSTVVRQDTENVCEEEEIAAAALTEISLQLNYNIATISTQSHYYRIMPLI